MNHEELLKLISGLSSNGRDPELDQLLVSLEKLAKAHLQSVDASSEAEIGMVLKQMQSSYQQLQEGYERICKEGGLSQEEMESYVKDSRNFSTKDWEDLQFLGRKLEVSNPSSKPKTATKKRKKPLKEWASA